MPFQNENSSQKLGWNFITKIPNVLRSHLTTMIDLLCPRTFWKYRRLRMLFFQFPSHPGEIFSTFRKKRWNGIQPGMVCRHFSDSHGIQRDGYQVSSKWIGMGFKWNWFCFFLLARQREQRAGMFSKKLHFKDNLILHLYILPWQPNTSIKKSSSQPPLIRIPV